MGLSIISVNEFIFLLTVWINLLFVISVGNSGGITMKSMIFGIATRVDLLNFLTEENPYETGVENIE